VSAKDKATNKEQKITITASSGLSKDEVDRMQKDAELHAEEDKKRREEIESRNKADQAVYQAERMLKDAGDKLTASDRQPVEAAMQAVKDALDKNDPAAVNSALEQLTQAQHKAAEALYRTAQTAGAAAGAGAGGGASQAGGGASSESQRKEGDVIDAEVVEEDKR
jgi:molecular chaperone DnaK